MEDSSSEAAWKTAFHAAMESEDREERDGVSPLITQNQPNLNSSMDVGSGTTSPINGKEEQVEPDTSKDTSSGKVHGNSLGLRKSSNGLTQKCAKVPRKKPLTTVTKKPHDFQVHMKNRHVPYEYPPGSKRETERLETIWVKVDEESDGYDSEENLMKDHDDESTEDEVRCPTCNHLI